MANHPVVQRTAPIAIAPKPSRPEPTVSRTDSFQRLELGSLHARSSAAGFTSRSASASLNGASVPPCHACRHAGTRCTMSSSDDDEGCIPCQVNGCECSLTTSTSPQSRKRKLNGEHVDDSTGKRSVHSIPIGPLPLICHARLPRALARLICTPLPRISPPTSASAGVISWECDHRHEAGFPRVQADTCLISTARQVSLHGEGTLTRVSPAQPPAAHSLRIWPTLAALPC